MNVLIDYHHTDLAESLHRLFERLGFTVYVPDGLDWFEQGYWQFGKWTFGDDRLGRQFLLAPAVDDLNPTRTLNRLSLEEARSMDFDVVVATVPDNYRGYAHFAAEKSARLVIEVGNVNQPVDHDLHAMILDSTGAYPNAVQFTPEFDIDGAYKFSPKPYGFGTVSSFVNLFPLLPCYPTYELTMSMHDGVHRVFGHEGPDGFIKTAPQIGSLMEASDFIWHDKISGDGFGYVIHAAASVGRPIIGHASHYRGQLAEDLWEDGVTCIDLDRNSPEVVAATMQQISLHPDRHAEMCFNIAQRVRERIDFKADAERVADALGMAVAA